MRSLYHFFFLISSGLLFTNVSQVSAQTVHEERKVSSFENVIIYASENTYVHVSYDRSYKVSVKTDGRVVHKVKTTVLGDTLNVYLEDPDTLGDEQIDIYIRLPKAKRVIIGGSGQVEVIDGPNPNQLQTLTGNSCPLCS